MVKHVAEQRGRMSEPRLCPALTGARRPPRVRLLGGRLHELVIDQYGSRWEELERSAPPGDDYRPPGWRLEGAQPPALAVASVHEAVAALVQLGDLGAVRFAVLSVIAGVPESGQRTVRASPGRVVAATSGPSPAARRPNATWSSGVVWDRRGRRHPPP